MREWDRMCEISWFYMSQLWAISWWEELNWEDTNHIFLVRGVSHWIKSLFGFTHMLLAKFTILPAASNKFKRRTPKTPMWIMVNKALIPPCAYFNHLKLLKSFSSISPSIRQPHSTQGWPQNKSSSWSLEVLVAGGAPLASSGDAGPLQFLEPGDIFHSFISFKNRCFYLSIDVCFLKLKKPQTLKQ